MIIETAKLLQILPQCKRAEEAAFEGFCVYLTIYSGNKLPPFYVGSSSVDKVMRGYKGSVSSRRYKATWRSELKNNPHLFKTSVVKTFKTRELALEWENKIQKKLNVVENPLYCNLWYACGIFGYSNGGKAHPFYGKKLWTNDNPNPFKGRKHTSETKAKISAANKGRKAPEESRMKMSIARKGKPTRPCSDSKKKSISEAASKYMWITDGSTVQRHLKHLPLPVGFVRGRKLTIKKKKRCWE